MERDILLKILDKVKKVRIALNTLTGQTEAHTPKAGVDITSYDTAQTYYTCPNDGYVRTQGGTVNIVGTGGSTYSLISATDMTNSCLVRKGSKIYCDVGSTAVKFFELE